MGGQLETVETSVTETTTSPDEVGMELPIDITGRELLVFEMDADVFPEEVGMKLTTAVVDLELETLTDDATVADETTAEELAMLTDDEACVVDAV